MESLFPSNSLHLDPTSCSFFHLSPVRMSVTCHATSLHYKKRNFSNAEGVVIHSNVIERPFNWKQPRKLQKIWSSVNCALCFNDSERDVKSINNYYTVVWLKCWWVLAEIIREIEFGKESSTHEKGSRPCQSRGNKEEKWSGYEQRETLQETFLRKLLEKLIQLNVTNYVSKRLNLLFMLHRTYEVCHPPVQMKESNVYYYTSFSKRLNLLFMR